MGAASEPYEELEQLLARLEKSGEKSLKFAELERFGALYRSAAADLSRARDSALEPRRARYLDALVRRAHFALYAPPKRGLRPLWTLFTAGFAQTFRATLRLQALSLVLFAVGAIAGYIATAGRHELAYPLLSLMFPAEVVQTLIDSEAARTEYITAGQDSGTFARSGFALALAANNTRVALVSFAVGIAAAVPTILIQVLNGAVLGSMAALFDQNGVNLSFWAWILPHGVPEILALCVAATGGLLLGRALIDPQGRPRREALVRAGAVAAKLIGFAFVLLLYAAVIEGYFRQIELGLAPRFALAAFNAIALGLYLRYAGGTNNTGSR